MAKSGWFNRAAKLLNKVFGRKDYRDSGTFMNRNLQYDGHNIGEWTYGHPSIPHADHVDPVTIGRFCSIASGVTIFAGHDHRTDWVSTYPFQVAFPDQPDLPFPSKTKGPIAIGNDVWIGTDVLILSGVRIGNGAVIAARSVVTKNVPSYAIVAGVPARLVRYRFDESTRELLEQIAWWDWPLDQIREALPLLMSSDIAKFIARYRPSGAFSSSPRCGT